MIMNAVKAVSREKALTPSERKKARGRSLEWSQDSFEAIAQESVDFLMNYEKRTTGHK